MERVKYKITVLHDALKTLHRGIELFLIHKKRYDAQPALENEELFLGMRDSMIQRFEYCTDLFWKVLKIYLEEIEKVTLTTYSPRGVIRETVKTKTITEVEGVECMNMIVQRNKTSHIYHQETAEEIADQVPSFYELMNTVVDRVKVKVSGAA